MASLIEHEAKEHAYMRVHGWNKHAGNLESALFFSEKKYDGHKLYIKEMKEKKAYWYGTPPRSKVLNWLAHKLYEAAWGIKFFK